MKFQPTNVQSLLPGEYIKYISLAKVVSVSPDTYVIGTGYDEQYRTVECVRLVVEAVYDYDIAYANEKGIEVMPRRYEYDIPTHGNMMKVISGERINITAFSGVYDESTNEYVKVLAK